MVQEVCKTAEECTPAVNWITYLITALVGVKMLIILFLNLQGYFWWRNVLASYFTLSIKILLILSSGVVSIKILLINVGCCGVCISIHLKTFITNSGTNDSVLMDRIFWIDCFDKCWA